MSTTLYGRNPFLIRSAFSTAMSVPMLSSPSTLPERCGVTTVRGWVHSGCPSGRGSGSVTSRAAPKRWPLSSALMISSGSAVSRVQSRCHGLLTALDQRAAADVDEQRVGLKQCELLRVQHPLRVRRAWEAADQYVRLAQERLERSWVLCREELFRDRACRLVSSERHHPSC